MASSPGAIIGCPICDVEIPVPIDVTLETGDEPGVVMMVCTPDFADVWAHAWTHDG